MQVTDGRFYIYLQSNFQDAQGAMLRQRFSLAHELGHTLFYDVENGEIRPRRDSPRGENLEAACHKAASMILIPARALNRELKDRPLGDATSVIDLANRFEVSVEVMLRRLNDLGVFDQIWSPVLTRQQATGLRIEFAAYPPWLRSRLRQPTRGTSFKAWFGGTEHQDGSFSKDSQDGVLEARPVPLSSSATIFELRGKIRE